MLQISYEIGFFFVALTASYNFGRAILKAAEFCDRCHCERPIFCKKRLPKRAVAAHLTRELRCLSSASETWNIKHGRWAAAVRYPAVRRVFRVSAQLLSFADIHPEEVAASVHEE